MSRQRRTDDEKFLVALATLAGDGSSAVALDAIVSAATLTPKRASAIATQLIRTNFIARTPSGIILTPHGSKLVATLPN